MANLRTLKQFRGQEESFAKQYRVGEDVLVIFETKDLIFVRNLETDHIRVYHRGMALKGTYRQWRLFRQALRSRVRLTDQKIYDWSFRFKVDCMGAYRQPVLDESYRKVSR